MATTRKKTLVTPPINVRGAFVCYEPFALPLTSTFKCDAIRTIKELELRGINVLVEYYEPKGLGEEEYREDAQMEASIVTLKGTDGSFVYVPNTYIESYPGMNGLDYVRTVIALDLSVHISANVDLDFIKGELADVVKRNVGVESIPYIESLSYEDNVSHEEHVQLEAARFAVLSQYVPLEEQIRILTAKNDAMEKENEELLAIIASHPELGTPVPPEEVPPEPDPEV